MERIRYADDVPISFEVATVPYSLISSFSKSEVTRSFYHTLEHKGQYILGGAQQTVSAMLASERIAEYLDIKRNEPILRLRQVSSCKMVSPSNMSGPNMLGHGLNSI